jgi:hypothetical protein
MHALISCVGHNPVNLLPEEEQLVLRRPIVNPALKPLSIQDHHGWMEEIISARFPTTTNCTRTIVVNIYQIVELVSFPWTLHIWRSSWHHSLLSKRSGSMSKCTLKRGSSKITAANVDVLPGQRTIQVDQTHPVEDVNRNNRGMVHPRAANTIHYSHF